MDQERNLKLMQIAMAHLPEAKQLMEQKGINLSMEEVEPLISMFINVMNEAYELGKEDNSKV